MPALAEEVRQSPAELAESGLFIHAQLRGMHPQLVLDNVQTAV